MTNTKKSVNYLVNGSAKNMSTVISNIIGEESNDKILTLQNIKRTRR